MAAPSRGRLLELSKVDTKQPQSPSLIYSTPWIEQLANKFFTQLPYKCCTDNKPAATMLDFLPDI